jgi:LPXTG-motif cell wall-anchored protein
MPASAVVRPLLATWISIVGIAVLVGVGVFMWRRTRRLRSETAGGEPS